jgi:hypothetical protein
MNNKREKAFNSFADAQAIRGLARRDGVWKDGEEMQYQMLYAIGKLLEGISDQLEKLTSDDDREPTP